MACAFAVEEIGRQKVLEDVVRMGAKAEYRVDGRHVGSARRLHRRRIGREQWQRDSRSEQLSAGHSGHERSSNRGAATCGLALARRRDGDRRSERELAIAVVQDCVITRVNMLSVLRDVHH